MRCRRSRAQKGLWFSLFGRQTKCSALHGFSLGPNTNLWYLLHQHFVFKVFFMLVISWWLAEFCGIHSVCQSVVEITDLIKALYRCLSFIGRSVCGNPSLREALWKACILSQIDNHYQSHCVLCDMLNSDTFLCVWSHVLSLALFHVFGFVLLFFSSFFALQKNYSIFIFFLIFFI